MKKTLYILLLCLLGTTAAHAQVYNQIDESGQITQRDESNRNFNKHNNDTTKHKEIPKGLHAWTVDRKFGDISPAAVDTMPHLYQNTIFNTGIYGEYNTTGNNYTARLSRIVIDRPLTEQFIFTQPYSHVMKMPEQVLFTNTLSPFTNISYDNCGDKQYGEDHLNAKFAVNAGKRLGLGFDLDYAYARGYYQNQSTSHFSATFYASYLGDKYNMHTMFSTYHQKVSENGGITDDNYITRPETFDDSYSENEIPVVLEQNWNRNNNLHYYLSHRYNLGFYRMVKMTDDEIKARRFAKDAKKDKEKRDTEEKRKKDGEAPTDRRSADRRSSEKPLGRPDGAKIAGDEPTAEDKQPADSMRVKIDSQEKMDSLLAEKALQDSIDATMKKEYVPVTSFIHTLDVNSYDRIYQAYNSPTGYYANQYYTWTEDMQNGGAYVYDQTKHTSIKNTLAIALLEGFNKYAKAGLKVFAAYEYRNFKMPDLLNDSTSFLGSWKEHAISIGGQINKTQGNTLHYNLMAETWIAGEDIGQLKLNFSSDLNFKLFGDTVTLSARAYFYRLNPTFYQRNYHSKNLWWDNGGMSKETRTRIEGMFRYRKTDTQLRVAIEEIQNYTYFGMSYDATTEGRTNMTACVNQYGSNINLLTAQLIQNLKLGILHWENIITYQNSSKKDVLPVPDLNLFTNLFIKFKVVNQLTVELGGDMYFFSKYYAPDYSPQLGQFAVQENEASRVKIGGYPFVDVYANLHLKHTRFFAMFSHANGGSGTRNYFLTPHYPTNGRVFRVGVSWNFFN